MDDRRMMAAVAWERSQDGVASRLLAAQRPAAPLALGHDGPSVVKACPGFGFAPCFCVAFL